MALSEYFPVPTPVRLLQARPERILYGTDFPDLPYAWDRELRKLLALGLPEHDLAQILGQNAAALFDS
jgi:predicted TIM-barrel fold metal-dependent hydrolase